MPRPDVMHQLLRLCCVLFGVLLSPVIILQVGKFFELIFFNYGVRPVCTINPVEISAGSSDNFRL